MDILFLDTETTGLPNESQARVIEIGMVKFNHELGIVKMHDFLVNPFGVDPVIPPHITEINGITAPMLSRYGQTTSAAYTYMAQELMACDLIMCANVPFDRGFLQKEFQLAQMTMPPMPWADFLTDIPYPKKIKGRSVAHIAADHGVLNPFPHRALTDALTMVACFMAGKYDVSELVETAKEPKVTLEARVSYHDRDLAKAKGFRFESPSKAWRKVVPQSKVQDLVAECDFPVIQLG